MGEMGRKNAIVSVLTMVFVALFLMGGAAPAAIAAPYADRTTFGAGDMQSPGRHEGLASPKVADEDDAACEEEEEDDEDEGDANPSWRCF